MDDVQSRAWWLEPLVQCQAALQADSTGLTGDEALRRLRLHGPNTVRERAFASVIPLVLSRFRNPLVIVLLIAAGISASVGEVADFVIITALVLMSIILDTVQEYRAGKAAEKLRSSVALRATALRDGVPRDVPAVDIVPGDVVLLAAGDLVPSDGRLLEARDLFINQALLTGEPFPVEKKPGEIADADSSVDRAENAVFAGTSVVSGTARMLVVKTGRDSALGVIAGTLFRQPPPTSYEMGLRRFGLLILRLTIALCLVTLLANVWVHRPWLDFFLFSLALAVGLTPELLPMVVSITLSRGAIRMAANRVIVKRLSAIHDLGAADVLCTDKTGTLTEARIQLERCVDAEGRASARVLELAYLNSRFQTGLRSPLDEAILQAGNRDTSSWTKIDEVPFDFERRRVSVLVDDGSAHLLVVKGAAEAVMDCCSACGQPGGTRPMDPSLLTAILASRDALEAEGLRTLAVAWKQAPRDLAHASIGDESGLVFAGFAVFLDPPKPGAAEALRLIRESGIQIKIITGDSDRVARHVCASLGIPTDQVVLGDEISKLDNFALAARAETAALFCRVTPMQKQRIILALKQRGHTVCYLGDGINDAPSLHSADVGLSVDSAVDVAKEAADMILLDRDLRVLHRGVVEGRYTFANIMKYILMGTSSNFGNMFSMAGAALFLPFLPMLPTQVLLNNVLYDISEVPIPLDQVDPEDVKVPRVFDIRVVFWFMLAIGPISSVFDALTFYLLGWVLHASPAQFHTGWFVESLATQVLVIFVIRTRGNPFRSRAHPLLAATSLTVVGVGALLPFTPLAQPLGLVALPAVYYATIAVTALVYLTLVEAAKRAFQRRFHLFADSGAAFRVIGRFGGP